MMGGRVMGRKREEMRRWGDREDRTDRTESSRQ